MRSAEQFWAATKPNSSGCLEWQMGRAATGYGRVSWQGRPDGAHRVAWSLINGPIPAGKHILHRCDNPPCVNPAHLYAGDETDNAWDRHFRRLMRHPGLTADQRRQVVAQRIAQATR